MIMKRKHIITISGKPGSGKSSTADKLAELLEYTRYSSGDYIREFLRTKNITLSEYNKQATINKDLDNYIDQKLRSLRSQNDIIIDSRLGFYWIPESFKVYLDLDIDVATARIFSNITENKKRSEMENPNRSLTTVARQVKERMLSEQKRFIKMYHVDPYEKSYFDLIIDTSRQTPQSVAIIIFDYYKKWLNSDNWQQKKYNLPIGYSLDRKF